METYCGAIASSLPAGHQTVNSAESEDTVNCTTTRQLSGDTVVTVSLHAGPGYVALIQTAASLPYSLLALPAGSAGDIFDRPRLILFTEVWMMGGLNWYPRTTWRRQRP